MKRLTVFLLGALLAISSVAQSISKPLAIGDRCPSISFSKVVNGTLKAANLGGFRGRLVILDFMGTTCTDCIRSLPRFDSLQKAFGDSLLLLPVATESEAAIRKMLARPYLRGVSLPFVVEDKQLSAAFPHLYLPHEVWIDGSGKVVAITSGQYITAANIRQALRGEPLLWPLKRDVIAAPHTAPLVVANKALPPVPALYYTAFSGYAEGVEGNYSRIVDTATGRVHYFLKNRSAVSAYSIMVGGLSKEGIRGGTARFRVEVRDSACFFYNGALNYLEEWERENTVCYEASLPMALPEAQRLQWILSDLDRYLGLHGRFETRTVTVWVITGLDTAAFGKEQPSAAGAGSLRLRSVKALADHLNRVQPVPVFDSTGIKGEKVLFLPCAIEGDRVALERWLKEEGLGLRQEVRALEFFILSDN